MLNNSVAYGEKGQTTVERVENMRGGKGYVTVERLLTKEQMNGKSRMFAKLTIPAGCSLGYHEHKNESETYYILSGKGLYDDNGEKKEVNPGDVTFTPDGYGHGIENIGETDLVFMALILLD